MIPTKKIGSAPRLPPSEGFLSARSRGIGVFSVGEMLSEGWKRRGMMSMLERKGSVPGEGNRGNGSLRALHGRCQSDSLSQHLSFGRESDRIRSPPGLSNQRTPQADRMKPNPGGQLKASEPVNLGSAKKGARLEGARPPGNFSFNQVAILRLRKLPKVVRPTGPSGVKQLGSPERLLRQPQSDQKTATAHRRKQKSLFLGYQEVPGVSQLKLNLNFHRKSHAPKVDDLLNFDPIPKPPPKHRRLYSQAFVDNKLLCPIGSVVSIGSGTPIDLGVPKGSEIHLSPNDLKGHLLPLDPIDPIGRKGKLDTSVPLGGRHSRVVSQGQQNKSFGILGQRGAKWKKESIGGGRETKGFGGEPKNTIFLERGAIGKHSRNSFSANFSSLQTLVGRNLKADARQGNSNFAAKNSLANPLIRPEAESLPEVITKTSVKNELRSSLLSFRKSVSPKVVRKASDQNLSEDPEEGGCDSVIDHELDGPRRILIDSIRQLTKATGEVKSTSLEFYNIIQLLGEGSYGKVYLAVSVLCGLPVAIKCFDRSKINSEKTCNRIMDEITILKTLHHPNLIRFLEIFENSKFIFLVIEYADRADLLKLLKSYGTISELDFMPIFDQLLKGLVYLHSHKILHRDIKLDNILLNSRGQVKICDMGVSCKMTGKGLIFDNIGTPVYIAPEIFAEKGYSGFKADVWSLGVLTFIALFGFAPFKGESIAELSKNIMTSEPLIPENHGLSPLMHKILLSMMNKDPQKRSSAEQIADLLLIEKDDPSLSNRLPVISERRLEVLKSYGFSEKQIVESVEKGIVNHITALNSLFDINEF